MQVTCPNCGARYAVDPLAIGPVGRIVQCARCSNRWLQTVAAAAAQAAARDAVDAAMNSSPTASQSGSDSTADTVGSPADSKAPPFGKIPPSFGSPQLVDPNEPVPDLVIRPPRQRTSLPAVIASRKKSRLPVLIGAGLGMVVVIAAVGAAYYFYREAFLAKVSAVLRFLLYL